MTHADLSSMIAAHCTLPGQSPGPWALLLVRPSPRPTSLLPVCPVLGQPACCRCRSPSACCLRLCLGSPSRCPRQTPLYLLPCCPLASLGLVSGSLSASSSVEASRAVQSLLAHRLTLSCVSGSCGDQVTAACDSVIQLRFIKS